MHLLRREVELPTRLHQRVSFYLAVSSFLLSFSIILDAAFWARPTVAVERAVTVRRLHLRPPCRERKPASPPPTSPSGEYHEQLIQQLAHPWAAADDLDPGARYGQMNITAPDDGAPGNVEKVIRRVKRSGVSVSR